MALTPAAIAALNDFTKQQPALRPYGQLDGNPADDIALGTQMNNGSILADSVRNGYETFSIVLPSVQSALTTVVLPLYIAPFAGTFVSAQLVAVNAVPAVTAALSATTFVVRRLNNTPANLTQPTDLASGVSAATTLQLPTGAKNALLTTSGATYSVTASSTNLTLNAATGAFIYVPAVGDWLEVGNGATEYLGASLANVGLYKITAASATQIVGAKQNTVTSPANVSAVAAQATDVTNLVSVSQQEASFSVGDILGLQVNVPATGGQDLSANKVLVQFNLKPALF